MNSAPQIYQPRPKAFKLVSILSLLISHDLVPLSQDLETIFKAYKNAIISWHWYIVLFYEQMVSLSTAMETMDMCECVCVCVCVCVCHIFWAVSSPYGFDL